MNRKSFFTLIELIVSIVVIGIILSIVVANILSSKKEAIQASMNTNISILQNTTDEYFLRGETTPPTVNEITPTLTRPQPIDVEMLVKKGYLKKNLDTSKIKNQYYWIDSYGKVWGATEDLINDFAYIKYSDKMELAFLVSEKYNGFSIYEVNRETAMADYRNNLSANLSKGKVNYYKEIVTMDNEESEDYMSYLEVFNEDSNYLISVKDQYDLETAPVGQGKSDFEPLVEKEGIFFYKIENKKLMTFISYWDLKETPGNSSISYRFSVKEEINGEYSEWYDTFEELLLKNPKGHGVKVEITMKGDSDNNYPTLWDLHVLYTYEKTKVKPTEFCLINPEECSFELCKAFPAFCENDFCLKNPALCDKGDFCVENPKLCEEDFCLDPTAKCDEESFCELYPELCKNDFCDKYPELCSKEPICKVNPALCETQPTCEGAECPPPFCSIYPALCEGDDFCLLNPQICKDQPLCKLIPSLCSDTKCMSNPKACVTPPDFCEKYPMLCEVEDCSKEDKCVESTKLCGEGRTLNGYANGLFILTQHFKLAEGEKLTPMNMPKQLDAKGNILKEMFIEVSSDGKPYKKAFSVRDIPAGSCINIVYVYEEIIGFPPPPPPPPTCIEGVDCPITCEELKNCPTLEEDFFVTVSELKLFAHSAVGEISTWTGYDKSDTVPEHTRILYKFALNKESEGYEAELDEFPTDSSSRSIMAHIYFQVDKRYVKEVSPPTLEEFVFLSDEGEVIPVEVSDTRPQAFITFTKTNNAGRSSISDTSIVDWTYYGYDPSGLKIVDYEWIFGNGEKSELKNTYAAGSYEVGLRVKNSKGEWSLPASYKFTVYPEIPTISWTSNVLTYQLGQKVDWNVKTEDLDGDGIQNIEYEGTKQDTYSAVGNYTVRVRVIDKEGNVSAWITKTVKIEMAKMELAFSTSINAAGTSATINVSSNTATGTTYPISIKQPNGAVVNGNKLAYTVSASGTYQFTANYPDGTNKVYSIYIPLEFTYTKSTNGQITITGMRGERTSISIPSTIEGMPVVYIGQDAFLNKNITSVNFSNATNLISIGQSAFQGTKLTSVSIPNSLTSIGAYAFNTNTITTFNMNNSKASVSTFIFGATALKFSVGSNNPMYKLGSNGYALYSLDGKILYAGSNSVIGTAEYNQVTTIGNYAFYNKAINKQLILPPNVVSINQGAFQGTGVNGALNLPDSTKTIGVHAFVSTPITSVNLNKVETIGDSAFRNTAIATVSIPETIKTIDGSAFARGSNLVTYNVSANNPYMKHGSSNRGIYSKDGKTIIAGQSSVFGTTDYNNVEVIGTNSFRGRSLTSVTLHNNITTIKNSAFQENGITALSIPASVKSIEGSAFQSNQLARVVIPNTVTSFGSSIFSTNVITSCSLPTNMTTIPSGMFYQNKLTSPCIPSSATTIGSSAFAYNNIANLSIGGNVQTIQGSAFYSNNLTTITIPATVKTLATYAFYNNPNLKTVVDKSNLITNANKSTIFSSNPTITR